MIPKTTYTTDLTSGEEGLEDGILLQHLRTTRSSSVELSELVGDVFGAIDWNSRRTGTPNKLGQFLKFLVCLLFETFYVITRFVEGYIHDGRLG